MAFSWKGRIGGTAMKSDTTFQLFSSCTQSTPFALAVLGPNGAGKSSIEHVLGIGDASLMRRVRGGRMFVDESTGKLGILTVNADAIAKALLSGDDSMTVLEANLTAQKEAEGMRRLLAERRADFAFESVASHPSKLEFLKELKAYGYHVGTLLVSTESPEINVRRVASRVQTGGHDVPTDKIISRYYRFSDLIFDYYNASDFFVAYDNSRDSSSESESSARLLLTKDLHGTAIEPACSEVEWIHRYLLDRLDSQP